MAPLDPRSSIKLVFHVKHFSGAVGMPETHPRRPQASGDHRSGGARARQCVRVALHSPSFEHLHSASIRRRPEGPTALRRPRRDRRHRRAKSPRWTGRRFGVQFVGYSHATAPHPKSDRAADRRWARLPCRGTRSVLQAPSGWARRHVSASRRLQLPRVSPPLHRTIVWWNKESRPPWRVIGNRGSERTAPWGRRRRQGREVGTAAAGDRGRRASGRQLRRWCGGGSRRVG
ncbi:MAG: hypothetical protein QOH36_1475 [Actinomycetota bacterium]|nr:hypothetical protein [Actinomycetota bacterium]